MTCDRTSVVVSARARARAAWLATTALTMLTLAHAGRAQTLAADTTPQGGAVVAGSASIAQGTGSTVITQTSQRTAIDWKSYNVGSNATVQYVQPNSSAIALNRVVSANPSIIAGHIDANGQIVLINQSGVVFTKGSQVNAESIFVSTSNITNKDFMAGRMNFSGSPNPGAKIVNDGQLTAKQAGLVGLVAPQVINNGIITARLGQVILAGASAFTLDLYGDKLISFDVTKAVSEVDLGGKKVAALVTNRGVILADGGKITMTAVDADALVSELIEAGGTMRADSVGSQKGSITLNAVGGNIQIAGNLLARGQAAATSGGIVQAAATGTIAVTPTALVDTSGVAGGGQIALGTAQGNIAKAAVVSIASGAHLKADATQNGNGGTVTLNSQKETDFQGTISAQGGSLSGNGGTVDISTDGVVSLGGTVLDTAPHGQAGTVLLDPATLVVGTNTTSTTISTHGGSTTIGGITSSPTISYVDTSDLDLLTGTIVLEASKLLLVTSAVNITAASELDLVSSQAITIGAGVTVSNGTSGSLLEIDAGTTLEIDAPLSAATVSLNSGGDVSEGIGGAIAAVSLSGSIGGNANLSSSLNAIGTLNNITVVGNLDLNNNTNLSLTGTDVAQNITLAVNGTLGINGLLETGTIGRNNFPTATSGTIEIAANGLTIGLLDGISMGSGSTIAIAPYSPIPLDLGGTSAGGLELNATTLQALESNASVLEFGTFGSFAASTVVTEGNLNFGTATVTLAAPTIITTGSLQSSTLVLAAANLIDNTGTLQARLLQANAATVLNTGTITGTTLALTATGLTDNGGTLAGQFVTLSAATLLNTGTITGTTLALATTGLTDNGGTLAGQFVTLSGATLLNTGNISATVLDFSTTGSFTSTGGIAASTLAGSAGTAISLSGANTIGTLGNVSGSNIFLADNTALTIAGTVSTSGSLSLDSTSPITEKGGIIDATEFDTDGATIAGILGLGGHNTIGTIGFAAATGNITLTNGTALSIGTLESGGALVLSNSGTVVEAANGLISAATLTTGTGSISGGVTLAGTTNAIGTLGTLDITNNFVLNNGTALTIGGLVNAANVTLNNSGNINEVSGGTIEAATFIGVVTLGSLNLANANDISSMIQATASGNIVLNNSGNVTIAASTGNELSLEGGSYVEAAGYTISAGTLDTGTASVGSANLGQVNNINTLGNFTATGNVTLVNGTSLDVTGPVNARNITLAVAGALGLNGALSASSNGEVGIAANGLSVGAGGTIAAPGGTIEIAPYTSGATLDIGGTLAGDFALTSGVLDDTASLVEFGTFGSFAASAITVEGSLSFGAATLALDTSGAIDNSGTLAGQLVTLSGTDLLNTGSLSATILDFTTTGSFTSTGGIVANTLAGNAGAAISLSGANNIGTLGNVSGSNIMLADNSALAIAGTVSTAGSLSLDSTNPVTETSGVIEATEFDTDGATIAGNLALGGHNNIGTIGFAAATGNVTLVNATSLAIGTLIAGELTGTIAGALNATGASNAIGTLGALDATGSIALNNTSSLTIAGLVSATSFTLNNAAGVTEITGGGIDTTIFTGSFGGALALGQTNNIHTLGLVSAVSSILLADNTALNISGNVTTPGLLTINDSSSVSATGNILAGTLAGSIGGAGSFTGSNNIGTLGGLTLGGTLLLDDGAPLDIAGLVSAPSATLNATALSELAGGTLAMRTLSGSIGGDATLGNANSIDTLGNLTLNGGTLTLDDTAALSVAGNVNAAAVSLTSPSLSVPGTLMVAGLLDVNSTSGLDETGLISAGTLAGSLGGAALLTASSTIGSLGTFTATTIDIIEPGTLTLAGAVTASGGQVTLVLGGLQEGTGGTLNAAGGTIDIAPYGNAALDLGGSSGTGLDLSSSLLSALDPNAVLTFGAAGNVIASSILAEGNVSFSNPDIILLTSGQVSLTGALAVKALAIGAAGITEPGRATLTATALTSLGTIGGGVTLAGSLNNISTLGNFAAAQAIDINDDTNLTVTGPVHGAGITLSAQGLALDGTLTTNNGGTLALVANQISASNASLAAPGGTVSITPLSSGTNIYLGGTGTGLGLSANLISNISAGELILATSGGIITSGAVTVTPPVLLLSAANGIALDGSLNEAGLVELAGGGLTANSAGALTAGTLVSNGVLTGALELGQGGNHVGTLGTFAATGGVTLSNASALDVTGNVTGTTIALSANGLTLASLLQARSVVQLQSSNGITETGSGSIIAPTLSSGGSAISGNVFLTNVNSISTLADFSANGDLRLTDASALSLTGNDAAADITLSAPGLVFAGNVTAPGTLALASTSGVAQTGGAITAAVLTSDGGAIQGAASFGQSNNISTLGNFAASGALTLNDAAALTVNGPVLAQNVALSANGLALNGAISTGVLQLASSNGVSEGGGGKVSAATLTGAVTGNAVLNSNNAIGTLGNFSTSGELALDDSSALTLNGNIAAGSTLALLSAGGINQVGGAITTPQLTSDGGIIGGNALFGQTGNNITAIGGFAATGAVLLQDNGALALNGNISAATLSLDTDGAVAQTGGVLNVGVLNADPSSIDLGGQNDIAAVNNLTATGDVTLAGVSAITGIVQAQNATITSNGNLSLSGGISVANQLGLSTAGNITQSGGYIAATNAALSGQNIALAGNDDATEQFNISASGNVTQSGGNIDAANVVISGHSLVLDGAIGAGNELQLSASGDIIQNGGGFDASSAQLSGQNVTLNGDDSVAGQLNIAASGNIIHNAGVLDAGTLTGTAGQLASFASSTDIGTLGSFIMQDSVFDLANDGPLVLVGPLVANQVSISVNGQLTLMGSETGGLFITGTIAPDQTTAPNLTDSVITVTDRGGPEIVQTGTFYINSGPNAATYLGTDAQPATLFLNATQSGGISFANYPDGLYAPSLDLVMAAGAQGTIAGNVSLDHIEILSALSTDLTGAIGGISGPTAAGNGSAFPFPQPNYRFNACPIGSVNCIIIPVETLPPTDPLQNFNVSVHKRKRLNANVSLPGIATRDY